MFKYYTRSPRVVQSSYNVNQVAKLYNFPPGDGSGQTVGLIELGGGYTLADLTTYGQALGLPPIHITTVVVDGGLNDPTDTSGASDEVLLDIEAVYAVVPKASIRVYFAPNTYSGFLDAINQAVIDKCNVISISWGASEDQWDASAIVEFEKAFQDAAQAGVTVLAAAGDNGYLDSPVSRKPAVDYPGSSVWVTSCGGTQLQSNGSETTWNNLNVGEGAGGGGMSALFMRPIWQTNDKITQINRCVPDVCANASPLTGYNILINNEWVVIGGTSAVAPLLAGLVARLNQTLGKKVGYLNPLLYKMNGRSFYDVTVGSDGWFTANSGYDLASGLGRLIGTNLISDIEWAMEN